MLANKETDQSWCCAKQSTCPYRVYIMIHSYANYRLHLPSRKLQILVPSGYIYFYYICMLQTTTPIPHEPALRNKHTCWRHAVYLFGLSTLYSIFVIWPVKRPMQHVHIHKWERIVAIEQAVMRVMVLCRVYC